MEEKDAAGWLLTFDPVGGQGAPVVIHLTDEQYERAVVHVPLERLADEIERLRELESD